MLSSYAVWYLHTEGFVIFFFLESSRKTSRRPLSQVLGIDLDPEGRP